MFDVSRDERVCVLYYYVVMSKLSVTSLSLHSAAMLLLISLGNYLLKDGLNDLNYVPWVHMSIATMRLCVALCDNM